MRFQSDRNPLPTPSKKKKKIHQNTKLLDLVTTGQAWDTCQRL